MVDGRILVGGTFSRKLVSLNSTTGQRTRYIGARIQGSVAGERDPTEVFRFAVNRRGTRLVAVGNFATVGGEPRKRAFMLELGTRRASLDAWYYDPLRRRCASRDASKQAYLEDVDFAPSGRWFAVVATGFAPRFAGQIGTSVCDAAVRFESAVDRPLAPT